MKNLINLKLKKLISCAKLTSPKRVTSLLLVINLLLISIPAYSVPLTYGFDSVTAGDPADITNDQVTVPFGPTSVAICNFSTSITLWVDMSDGVAVAESNSTNIAIAKETCMSFPIGERNVLNTLVIGLITASSTAEYSVSAMRIQ